MQVHIKTERERYLTEDVLKLSRLARRCVSRRTYGQALGTTFTLTSAIGVDLTQSFPAGKDA